MASFAPSQPPRQELDPIPAMAALSMQQQQQPQWIIHPESLAVNNEPPLGEGAIQSSTYRGTLQGHLIVVRKLATGMPWQPLAETMQRSLTLQNPHVLQIFGISHQSVQPAYMVYPFFEYGNVMQYLRRVPDAMRARLVYEVSLGMEYLHSMNIIHGRLKPTNILVTSDGHACVTDYGLYQLGAMPPSPYRYYSPEAWKGETSKSSDVFAFAMSAYEIFTSNQPWGILSDSQILQLMAREGERPNRPDPNGPFAIMDRDWQILQDAWKEDAYGRPSFAQISARISAPNTAPAPVEAPAVGTSAAQLGLPQTAAVSELMDDPADPNALPAPPPYSSADSPTTSAGPVQPSGPASESSGRRSTMPYPANDQRFSIMNPTHVQMGEIHQPMAGPPTSEKSKMMVANAVPFHDFSSSMQGPAPPMRDARFSSVSSQQFATAESAYPQSVLGYMDRIAASAPPTAMSFGQLQPMDRMTASPAPTAMSFGQLQPMDRMAASPAPTAMSFGQLPPRAPSAFSSDSGHFRPLSAASSRPGFDPPSQRSSGAFSPRLPFSEWSGPGAQLALGGGIPERPESVLSHGSAPVPSSASVFGGSNRPSATIVAGALDAEISKGRNKETIDGYLEMAQQLANESQREAEKLITAGVITSLIVLLKSRAMDGQGLDVVLKTLGVLARDQLSANTIFRTNTSDTLLEIIDTSMDENCVALALWCLSRLSRTADLAQQLIKSDLVSLLITKGLAGPVPTATAASWCLGNLVYNDNLAETLGAMQSLPQALVGNLQHALVQEPPRPEYVSAAIYPIARLSRTIKLAKALAKSGCVEPLVQCLNNSNDPDVLMWSARAVGCLMRPNSADMSKTLLEAGAAHGLARLPKVIPSENVRPLEAFAFTIQRFSIAEWGSGTRKALVEAGVVDSLLAALRTASDSTDSKVHVEIAVAISALGDVGGGEIRKEIIRAGGVEILKQVGKSKEKDVVKACSMAVTSVTGNLWTRNTASAKAAMMHNWSGGCPDHQPECPLQSSASRLNPYVMT